MKFEQAAALKILFGDEEVQPIQHGRVCTGFVEEGNGDPPGHVVEDHGIVICDHAVWEVEEGIRELARYYGLSEEK